MGSDSPADETSGKPEVTSTQAETAAPEVKDVNKGSAAESSPAAGVDEKQPKSMLDAVRAAMGGKEKSSGSEGGGDKDAKSDAAPAAEGEKPDGETDEGEDLGEVTADELARMHSKTRRRVKQLLGERDKARADIAETQPKAQAYDRIATYVSQAGLSKEEVNTGFEIMRLMKADPFAALDTLKPYVDALMQATGAVLPADLQQKVSQGYLSQEDAAEMARLRALGSHSQVQVQRVQEVDQQRQATEAQQRTVSAVQGALTEWESSKSKSDPDYKLKAPHVQKGLKLRWLQGDRPADAAAAKKQADEVLAEVEKELGAFQPRKQEVTTVTGRSSGNAAHAPTSMLEAMKRAVGQ